MRSFGCALDDGVLVRSFGLVLGDGVLARYAGLVLGDGVWRDPSASLRMVGLQKPTKKPQQS